ncbi:MAG: hypothetical protein GTN38_02155 [Candidatus Aenigmarchaeota archaeon]|nr:hypothetical protein [Candidatus Aenigmarchaeota archaeon]NIP40358.1 hypothetical protein [Candidatus Aenigmarchaeota archaeon]NIQ18284.1 hypothetical protein [Candidatus Aenigmarchaeota archaeon]NIS73236.1 hypothetical protein [Candidatus Aenigmarchaeota archaeon]
MGDTKILKLYTSVSGPFDFPEDPRLEEASGLKGVYVYYNPEENVYGIVKLDIKLNPLTQRWIRRRF